MLTKKQRDLLAFIHKRMQKDGVPPSFEEMKDALDLRSKSGIHRLITALEERGFLRRLPHKARALEIIKLPEGLEDGPTRPARPAPVTELYPESSARAVPMLGRIAAGVPIEAVETGGMGVSVPSNMLGQGEHYALEVRGDSMIDAGINDGDIVVIRETGSADNGDIVVALIEDHEATLKKFRRANGMIALEAANPAYETRILRDDQVKVQGQLVGLIRSY